MSTTAILLGGSPCRHVGDDAILAAVLARLKRQIPILRVIVLTRNPKFNAAHHNTECDIAPECYIAPGWRDAHTNPIGSFAGWLRVIYRASAFLYSAHRAKHGRQPVFLGPEGRRVLNHLLECDVVFCVGGGNLNSIYRWGGLVSRCYTFVVCEALGKPVILSGQTIGPLTNAFDRRVAAYALNRVDFIGVREARSKEILRGIGVTKPVIMETGDDAFFLPPESPEKVEAILRRAGIDLDKPLIGFGVHRWASGDRLEEVMAQLADHLISTRDATVVFIPMEFDLKHDDRTVVARIVALMRPSHRAKVIDAIEKYDDQTIKGLVGRMSLVVGTRYHLIVFAASMGVPSVALYGDTYYDIKMNGIMDSMGQGRFACQSRGLTVERLKMLVEEAWKSRDQIEKELKEHAWALESINELAITYAAGVLNKRSRETGSDRGND